MSLDLSGLKDIHLPLKPSWWPPAIGWWFVFMGILVVLFLMVLLWKYRNTRPRQCALKELQTLYQTQPNVVAFARQVSVLLKRIALLLYPRSSVATLTDTAWRSFLKKKTGKTFSKEQLDLLAVASYMPEKALTPVATDMLFVAARQAINQLFERKEHEHKHTKHS